MIETVEGDGLVVISLSREWCEPLLCTVVQHERRVSLEVEGAFSIDIHMRVTPNAIFLTCVFVMNIDLS